MKPSLAMIVAVLCVSSVMTSQATHAQPSGVVPSDARVRVMERGCPCAPRIGRVLSSWGDSALVDLASIPSASADTTSNIRAFHISNLQVSRGYETHALRAMGRGGVIGAALGLTLGFALGSDCSKGGWCYTRTEAAAWLALPGLVLGTAVGGIIGLNQSRETWVPATDARRIGMTISPAPTLRGAAVLGTISY
jgi:hypothetical protein